MNVLLYNCGDFLIPSALLKILYTLYAEENTEYKGKITTNVDRYSPNPHGSLQHQLPKHCI